MRHHAEAHDERAEMLHLAQAFDGLVGALHDGHPVPRVDLEQAASAATWLWDAIGADHPGEFPGHRRVLMEHAAGASRGEAHHISLVQRAALGIAQDLRQQAGAVPDRRRAVEPELEVAVHHLDKRYARFAAHLGTPAKPAVHA
ncbi:MAG TPA: hypothetical protein VM286_05875 [Candidatus Thermoplasmatota archaeon]|nr:hypothetical protein [Candidatus Thermoplasmatota archaeon]